MRETPQMAVFQQPAKSIILRQYLEVSSGMLADRALIRDIFPFEDVAAIPAMPLHRSVFFEYFSALHIF
jgi:hypothetical protein